MFLLSCPLPVSSVALWGLVGLRRQPATWINLKWPHYEKPSQRTLKHKRGLQQSLSRLINKNNLAVFKTLSGPIIMLGYSKRISHNINNPVGSAGNTTLINLPETNLLVWSGLMRSWFKWPNCDCHQERKLSRHTWLISTKLSCLLGNPIRSSKWPPMATKEYGYNHCSLHRSLHSPLESSGHQVFTSPASPKDPSTPQNASLASSPPWSLGINNQLCFFGTKMVSSWVMMAV